MSIFKTVEESIELAKQGVPCDTGFEYVFNCEEVAFNEEGDDYEFNLMGDVDNQLKAIREIHYAGPKIVESGTQEYDEFTQVICPAYKAD